MATALAANRKAARLWDREWTFSNFMGRQDDEQSSYSQSLLAAGSRQNQGSVSLCRPETRLGKPCFRTCVSDESAVVTEFIEDSPELLDVPDELSTPKLPEMDLALASMTRLVAFPADLSTMLW